jgi:hypothetical protein
MTPIQRLWRIGGSVLAVVALMWFGWEAVDQLASRTESRNSRFEADSIDEIIVNVEEGKVTASGSASATEILTEASLRVGIFDPTYTTRRSGRSLTITSECGWLSDNCLQSLDLVVPAGIKLSVTSSNGDLAAHRISGDADLATDNGDIIVTNLSGSLTMRSDNGDLRGENLTGPTAAAKTDNGALRLEFGDSPTRVRAESDNGDVEVILPHSAEAEGIDFALIATTDTGTVTTPIRTNPESSRSIRANSDNGDVTVAYQP